MDPVIEAGVALVTGAGSGMGQTISVLFAKRGCKKIVLADLLEKGMQETKALIERVQPSVKVQIVKTDVTVESQVMAMVQKCVEVFGRLDFAVNSAGVGKGGVKTADMTVQMFDANCNVNEKGVFLCEKHEVAQMLKQSPIQILGTSEERAMRGSVVNIASMAGTAALTELSAYVSSKHAVVVMVRCDARTYAPDRIRINCVSPGFVDTPMMHNAGLSEEYMNLTKKQSPMNRFTLAEEVAESVYFLSSGYASGITGVNLNVDAGANLFHVI